MTLFCSILLLALTRAEIIDRFRAPPVTQLDGLVQVFGDCPADMRRDFQLPVASFASGVCRELYAAENIRPARFREPGIVIRIGDVRTNMPDVVVRPAVREGGGKFTRILLPSPSGADLGRLRLEVARAFYRAVAGEDLDDEGLRRRVRSADPRLRAEDIHAEVDAWRTRGEYAAGKSDDDYLKMQRGVHLPGSATKADVLVFASRLYLYPAEFCDPFCGRYAGCSFREAVELSAKDPSVRLAAYAKMQSLSLYGAGRGAKMDEAVFAYVRFLSELVRRALPDAELSRLLDEADAKLKGVLEE